MILLILQYSFNFSSGSCLWTSVAAVLLVGQQLGHGATELGEYEITIAVA